MNRLLMIIDVEETRFFGQYNGKLCQWVNLTVDHSGHSPIQAIVSIQARDQTTQTQLNILPGIHSYRCHAFYQKRAALNVVDIPTGPILARLVLTTDQGMIEHDLVVGSYRPWTIYVLADVCSDTTWVYDNEEEMRRDDSALLNRVLDFSQPSTGQVIRDPDYYNLVHSREAEYYLEQYPQNKDRFLDAVSSGRVTLNPFHNMCLTGCISLEELIRQFYPARRLAFEHNLPLEFSNHQETPTITWITASLMADSGIKRLVKAILPYECPWVARLQEPPLFAWEGPDGQEIWVRRRNVDYVEGAFLLAGLRKTNTTLHEQILPRYDESGDRYPFEAIALLGVYGDLSRDSWRQVEKKIQTIQEYNAQGWEYPKLVNAAHHQFWEHIERQMKEDGIRLERYRGDYGASWEAWPASLAGLTADWRRLQERSRLADLLAAVCGSADMLWLQSVRPQLELAWQNLIYLADHAWNGENDANRALNLSLRRQWVEKATYGFDDVISKALNKLASEIRTGDQEEVAVFNGLSWERSGLICLTGLGDSAALIDSEKGCMLLRQQDDQNTYFLAENVPPLGYRKFSFTDSEQQKNQAKLQPETSGNASCWVASADVLEGPFFRLKIDPATGAVRSLYDKARGKELVDSSRYHLNQAVYLLDGKEYRSRLVDMQPGHCGEIFGELVTTTLVKNARISTTYRIYHTIDRLDIVNHVHKLPANEREEFDFAFPFNLPNCQVRYEIPGVILDPQKELLPGAGMSVIAIRRFVDLFNQEYGVTVSQVDSFLVKFGNHPITEDQEEVDPQNGLFFAVCLQNSLDWHEAIRNQGEQQDFTFRFSIRSHNAGFSAPEAVHLGYEGNNELLPLMLPSGQTGQLSAEATSFFNIDPDRVVITTVKPAEEQGILLRLWELGGVDTDLKLSVHLLSDLAVAWQTDILERDLDLLGVSGNLIDMRIPARSIQNIRVIATGENRKEST